jgi:hypothetical protein
MLIIREDIEVIRHQHLDKYLSSHQPLTTEDEVILRSKTWENGEDKTDAEWVTCLLLLRLDTQVKQINLLLDKFKLPKLK